MSKVVTLDSKALGDLIAELVGDYADRALAPLASRLAELERTREAPKPRVRVKAGTGPNA